MFQKQFKILLITIITRKNLTIPLQGIQAHSFTKEAVANGTIRQRQG